MTTETKKISKHELAQFTGTTQYFNHWTKSLVYTDGVQYVGANGDYWIIDLIASYQSEKFIKDNPFQAWKVKPEIVHIDGHSTDGFSAVNTDGNNKELIRQVGEYTDLDVDIEFYLIADPHHKAVLILTSEY